MLSGVEEQGRDFLTHSRFTVKSVCCPYPFVAVPGVISFVALILSFIAAISCKFFSLTASDDGSESSVFAGLLSVEETEVSNLVAGDVYCTSWREATLLTYEDLDGALKAARAFGIISFTLGLIAWVMILVPSCVAFEDKSRNQYLMIICGLCICTGVATLFDLVSVFEAQRFLMRCFHRPQSHSYLCMCPYFFG